MLDDYDRRRLIELIEELQERRAHDDVALTELRVWRFVACFFAAVSAVLIWRGYL